jgi:TM2 domain-containing membrane protein YozV
MDSMIYCRDCGEEINERAEICPECGIRQKDPPDSITNNSSSSEKNEGLAAAASFVVPGLGQVYNGEIAKGIIAGAITVLFALTGIGLIIALPIWIWLVYDAYHMANDEDDSSRDIDPPSPENPDDILDEILGWYVEQEGVNNAAVGRTRMNLRSDGLDALSEDKLNLIIEALDEYDSRLGKIDTNEVREDVKIAIRD